MTKKCLYRFTVVLLDSDSILSLLRSVILKISKPKPYRNSLMFLNYTSMLRFIMNVSNS